MAATLFYITSVLMASLMVSGHNAQTVPQPTQGREVQPQQMIELINLMLAQNNERKQGFGIQRVPQEEVPNYEILITPNQNLQDLKGSQKIKIFVEAENVDGSGKALPQADGRVRNGQKSTILDVIPLSIDTVGLNIEHYQQPNVPIAKANGHNDEPQGDFESFPSKRQTNWGAMTSGITQSRQPEVKIVQPSYVDQSNPHQPVVTPKKEDRQRTPVYESSDYPSASQGGKRVSQQTYVDEYATPVEEVVRPQPRPVQKEYKRKYETTYNDETVYEEVRPERERRPVVKETEVVRPSNERRPTREPEMIRPSSERRPTVREPEQVRPSNERRPMVVEPEVVRPSPNRRQTYVEEDFRPSESRNPGYSRETNERRPTYVREESRKPVYDREPEDTGRYPEYDDARRPSDDGSSYAYEESRPSKGRRPAYEASNSDESGTYSGFPESYQTDSSHHYSTPLQSVSARAFPASPCLNVFKYEGREPEEDRWYADIYVTTDVALNGMRLDVTLDRPAELLTNWIAEVKTRDSIQFTLLSLTHKLLPGPAETVRIMVKFNGKLPVPFLKSISLNGRLICPVPKAQKTTTRRPVYENPGDLEVKRTTERYQEGPSRPLNFAEGYETNTKRPTGNSERTTSIYEEPRKPTRSPSDYPRPNPNGYDETNLNSFNTPTKKPPGRPSSSNSKPPPHAAKPSVGSKPSTSQNSKPPSSSGSSKPSTSSSSSTNNKPATSLQGTQKQIGCGTASVQPRPLITHGQLTARGQWPWHVALYKNVGTDLTFFCGGTLINNNYVLTAAHCVTKTYTTKPVDESSLVVLLGKYHLKLWSEGGVQNRQVSKIYIHPNYNSTDFRCDIAILALSSPVEYTDYIRPICLWDRSNTRLETVLGKEGTVVGWGFDETKKLTEELRQAKMPVVEQKTCLWSYPDFYPQFTSNLTYCAGFKNGTSVCNGDSGGGMVFFYKDKSGVERWHIRGIVSISPARNDSRVCDPTHYVVFTDVAKFLPWLDEFV